MKEEEVTYQTLMNMKLHEVVCIHKSPYFRVMRVAGGWMYDFWSEEKQDYLENWIYVPLSNF